MGFITDCYSLFENDYNYHTDIPDNEISDEIKDEYYQNCVKKLNLREITLQEIENIYPTRGDKPDDYAKNLLEIERKNQLEHEIKRLQQEDEIFFLQKDISEYIKENFHSTHTARDVIKQLKADLKNIKQHKESLIAMKQYIKTNGLPL